MQTAAGRINTTPRPDCFLCGKAGVLLHDNLKDFHFSAPGIWKLKKCPGPECGLVWLDPFPVSEDLHLAYETYYTHSADAGNSGGSGGLRDLFYKSYQTFSLFPAIVTGLESEKRLLARMFLRGLPPGRLLDVGCGDGAFLDRMRREGWSVEGVDFDQRAIENANRKYGMKLHHGSIKTPDFAAAS